MYGSGCAGVFSAILQIICLAVAEGSSITAAMIYFTSGCSVMFITLVLAYLTKYSQYYIFYLGDPDSDTKKAVYTMKEIWETTKKTWSSQVIFSVTLSLPIIGHPNITCLIVSEYYDTGTEWNSK